LNQKTVEPGETAMRCCTYYAKRCWSWKAGHAKWWGVPRSSYLYQGKESDEERLLKQCMTQLALQYGRYGYRRITALLRNEWWQVNHKRIERLWRKEEGLKVPQRQLKRGRLWLNDSSYVRLCPEHKNHVWIYDFVHDQTRDGRGFRMLTIMDEFSKECLAIDVGRKLTHDALMHR
jgi:putative transposase